MSSAAALMRMYIISSCTGLMYIPSMLAPGSLATHSSSMFCSVTVHFNVHAMPPVTPASAAGSSSEAMRSMSDSPMMSIAAGETKKFVIQK